LSHEELIRRFESGDLPEDSFHHADHVRLAFAYLSRYSPLEALGKFSVALKRYASACGKSQLYHETMTHAYFFLIRERMARASAIGARAIDSCAIGSQALDWDEFERRNADLVVSKNGILARYYHHATLQSDLARAVFLFPDKWL
jgi:hypothetical protein